MSQTLFQLLSTATGWKLQFSGTVDVSQEEQRAILDSGLAVLMVAARAGKAELLMKENGDVGLKVTVQISDSAMMTGQLRDDAITYLAHGPDQGHLVFPNYSYTGEEVGPGPADGGPDLGEPMPEFADLDLYGDPPAEPVSRNGDSGVTEVLGHIGDYRGGAAPGPPSGGEGPKVGKFDPDMALGASPSGARRTIYPPGHRGTDKVLSDFMSEEHPSG